MKLWYVVPKAVWFENDPLIGMPRHAWFAGCSYVDLDAEHILVAGDFAKPHHQARWHDHPEVARLTHPQLEQGVPLSHLHTRPEHGHKQFKVHHFDNLQKLGAQHGFALNASHTLWDLHDAIAQHYPGIRLDRY